MSFEIRRLTQHDAAAWWRLRLEMLEREPLAFGSSVEDHRRTTVESAAARMGSPAPGSFVLGAWREGALEGAAGFYREQEAKSRHKGRIWGVYVTGPCRGQGMGRALMERIVAEVRQEPGLVQIGLAVTVEQTAARRLYESMGFEAYGREPRALRVDGQYIDEDLMVLKLR